MTRAAPQKLRNAKVKGSPFCLACPIFYPPIPPTAEFPTRRKPSSRPSALARRPKAALSRLRFTRVPAAVCAPHRLRCHLHHPAAPPRRAVRVACAPRSSDDGPGPRRPCGRRQGRQRARHRERRRRRVRLPPREHRLRVLVFLENLVGRLVLLPRGEHHARERTLPPLLLHPSSSP